MAGLFGRADPAAADRRLIRKYRGGFQSKLDREARPADLDELREFAGTRRGVEFYIEPETTATDTTAVAVATDGESRRRGVGSAYVAHQLADELGIPAYDAAVTGYPATMRRYRRARRVRNHRPRSTD